MRIHTDAMIAKYAREQRMITPFEATQIREVNGKPIISYGLSSFGYDIRVSNQFRIFTNVYGAVVDPKAFDPRGSLKLKTRSV